MKKYYGTLLVLIFTVLSCKETEHASPSKDEGGLPDPVTNIEVENLPGKAIITYSLPDSKNLLYVKALYSIRDGVKKEAKSSYFKNSIELDGFSESKQYEVTLYTVSRGEQLSEPLTVLVYPDTPPVMSTFKSLEIRAAFGGISVYYENQSEADLAFYLLAQDSTGKLSPAQTFYTKSSGGILPLRGYPAEEGEFAVYVEDRWGNISDTVHARLTPLFERELDKGNFAIVKLPTDTWEPNVANRTMDKLWDGQIAPSPASNSFNAKNGQGFPQHFTFDMGVTAQLSRMIYYPKAVSGDSYTNTPRMFEIWGSNDPAADGSWDSWTKLMECEYIKPSGLPGNEYTEDDRNYSMAGINFDFPEDLPPVRYIRFKTIDVWSGSNLAIYELTFFGSPQ